MLQDHWYIASASAQLAGSLHAARILNQAIVLFRDEEGKAHALQDRCCHRGLPLSKGSVVEGRVQCGFHGWQYDGKGACVKIPSQALDQPIAKVYQVKSFPCHEADGYVWVWMGGDQATPPPRITEFSEARWLQGSRVTRCNFLRALEITFDSAHVYFAHPKHPATIAAKETGLVPVQAELRLTDTGCAVVNPPATSDGPIPDTSGTMEFILPNRIRFRWPTPAGTYYMNFHVVPLAEDLCRIEYLVQNFYPSGPALQWSDGPSDIIDEDVAILEAIQATYEHEGDAFERSVEADSPALLLRRIVTLASEGKWRGLQTDLPRRRVISVMGAARFG
jgi:phenylpropionate dioxygenase-like ring-hydroxylating dioxygenase large terminal subunit